MEYEKQILSYLIDSYENRNPETVNPRKVRIDIAKRYPQYRDVLSAEQQEIETAIQHLHSWGFVIHEVDAQGYYTKLTLIESSVPQILHYLKRVPKMEMWEAQRSILKQTANHAKGLTEKFCNAMLARIEQRKGLPYGLAKDIDLLKDVLLALENIEKLKEETYLRNFSEMVFHDSKHLQSILNPITNILLDFGDEVSQRETVLAQHNVVSNPGYVYIKGDWQIYCQGRCISTSLLRGGIAICSDSLDAIERIEVPNKTVISVENLTTYHDTRESQGAVIYLGGFLNTVRTEFLKKLYADVPDAAYFHKGDLDPYGFLILENLKQKTGVPFRPLEMDLDTLRCCHRAGHFRPLDDADRKAMQSPAIAAYQSILQYMVEHNCKIEQECFEAMKLEQLVGV